MGSSSREDVAEVCEALDTDLDRLCELPFDALTTLERLRLLERAERAARRLRCLRTRINQLAAQASEEEPGAKLPSALANRLSRGTADQQQRNVPGTARLQFLTEIPTTWREFHCPATPLNPACP
jgi:hypothetical protein